jgi:hypothetical protein
MKKFLQNLSKNCEFPRLMCKKSLTAQLAARLVKA